MKALDAQTAALTPGSYHDFAGLTALKTKAKEAGQGDAPLRAAAQQFEAMFVQEIMRTMRQSGLKGELLDSHAMETFEGMFDKEVSMQMARRGSFGMADMLVKQMKRQESVAPAADDGVALQPTADQVLRSRESAGLPMQRPARAHALPRDGAAEAEGVRPARPGLALPQIELRPLPGRGFSDTPGAGRAAQE